MAVAYANKVKENLFIQEDSLVDEYDVSTPIIETEVISDDDEYCFYKKSVIAFTMLIGIIHKFYKMKDEGKEIDLSFYDEVVEKLEVAKEQLVRVKEELGLPGGLSFLENNKFDGFEIKEGLFHGDTEHVLTITSPWMNFNPDNCYLYEVAHYIQYLAFSDELYCGEYAVETLSVWERIKGGIAKCKKNLVSRLSALVPAAQADIF